ncbi:MAG: NAD-glutamate dehydrogenase domain-containing protein [Campylobacterales bacterium]
MQKKFEIESDCTNITDDDSEFVVLNLDKLKIQEVLTRVKPKEGESSEITIYSLKKRDLSSNLPILANLGFSIDSETSFRIKSDVGVIHTQKYFLNCEDYRQLKATSSNLEKIVDKSIKEEIKNTPLNSLAFKINCDSSKLEILRTIVAYEAQLVSEFSLLKINETLIKHALITEMFLNLFEAKFSTEFKNKQVSIKYLTSHIVDAIKEVDNINEDRILNCFFAILNAITRTNFYILHDNLYNKNAIAIKVDVTQLKEYLKGVQPRIETFVYHCSFEGVHLRRNSVSRGGLRWSDRFDDYRSEVRLLMQAQRLKNSIIIPTGAKGGFVIHKERVSKEEFREYYELFINSLLDMVDNGDGQTMATGEIIKYDKSDNYFVVAADKGTSDMSDVANSIAVKRGFWLKDAFASGGSRGYNHKDMGITAKGAIKSAERFFIEIGKNFYEDRVSVVGIGSPAGDVFGNGIQLSRKFALIAAVSSRDIFIDPKPDLERAYQERQRLFESSLGWSSYNKKLISKGGGVYKKSDKEIHLSKEAKETLGIKKDIVNGEELTRFILSAKVDMLFNGGVGTYVRGVNQSDTEIGDKPNESVRITSKDVKAFCVCEGGNLGFSQEARLEYAAKGGKISADSIDNSAGVQTSDYEVNLKVILNNLVDKGAMDGEKRDEILKGLIDEVEKIVLFTNYTQSLALSTDSIKSATLQREFKNTLLILEEEVDSFKRENFKIPGIDEFDRALDKTGRILRPVLSVLLSFSKIFLKSFLLKHPDFLDSEFCLHYLYKYFPKTFVAIYRKEIEEHPLRREIVATYIANKIINYNGATFISDYRDIGGERFLLKVKSFLVVNELISGNDIRFEIYRQDYTLSAKKQYDMLLGLGEAIDFLSSWIVERGEYEISIFNHLSEYKASFNSFIDSVEIKSAKSNIKSEKLERFLSLIEFVKMVLDIIKVKEDGGDSFKDVAELFYTSMQTLNITYLIDGIKSLKPANMWEEKMKRELEKELFFTLSKIVREITEFRRSSESIESAFKAYLENKKHSYEKYLNDIKEIKSSESQLSPVAIFVVINSLKKLS